MIGMFGRRLLWVTLASLGLVAGGDCLALGTGLFESVPSSWGDPVLVGEEGVERFRFVTVDFSQLGVGLAGGSFRAETRLSLNLFPGTTVGAELEWIGQGYAGGRLWVGRVEGESEGRVVFAFDERSLSGTVVVGPTVYQIRGDGDPVHLVRQLSAANSAELLPLVGAPGQGLTAEQQLFHLVNHERRIHGLYPYEWNELLAAAARAHSRDMARRSFFSHINPDGMDAGERMRAAGYDWAASGENIAAGQKTPIEVLEAWLNSPGHRRSILRDGSSADGIFFCDVGVGYVEAPHSTYVHYWTLKLGRLRGTNGCPPASSP